MRIRRGFLAQGFTMVELLIVIGILGILATGVVTVINPFEQLAKGRDAKRKTDLSSIQKALELYYQDNNRYPASTTAGEMLPAGAAQAASWGTNGFSPYMPSLPKDAIASKRYFYRADASGQTYWIFASLERGINDPQICNAGANTPCQKAALYNASCGSATDICNYGVSSPNDSPN